MNILVLGSGGREYAIIKSLQKNSKIDIYGLGDYLNPGILNMVKGFKIMEIFDVIEFTNFLNKINPRFVVVGPEKYLNLKIGEILFNQGIPCIGPFGIMAKIETSKIFCRQFLKHHNLSEYSPNLNEINHDTNLDLIFKKFNNNFVVKPNGLTGGKGVKLYNNQNQDAKVYINNILREESTLLLEELLYGEEFILLSFCDGKNIKHMPLIKDFKKVSEGSNLNTGSMGCIIQSNHKFDFLDNDDVNKSHELNKQVMLKLSNYHEHGYRGVLYGSYMKTNKGIKLIEFNARFGDPEVIAVLDILETDLFDIFDAISLQKLNEIDIKFKNAFALCKYLVPQGYPESPVKWEAINLSELTNDEKENVYLAGVKSEISKLVLTGSRALAVCKSGNNQEELYQDVENIISKIKGPLFYRPDIKNLSSSTPSLYASAGVNIEEGNKVVSKIRNSLESTYSDHVESQWGDFGGLFNMGTFFQENKYKEPIMVSSTDGVGTKTCFILDNMDKNEGMKVLGQDIVNHCVNDILVKGAIPLMFLDYFASSKIDSDLVASFVEGVSMACRENSCSLMGGETAEMPGVYASGKCDIVGTIMGIVDKNNMIMGKNDIEAGFLVYGIESSGPHTNGYSLIRKIYENHPNHEIYSNLFNPHKSYLKEIKNLIDLGVKIKGLCHVTGGGFYDNLPRVLPDNLAVDLNFQILSPFKELGVLGNISTRELLTVFNCGYGMLIFVHPEYQKIIDYKLLGRVVVKEKEIVNINIE